jgi:phospholipase/carboxylesterase
MSTALSCITVETGPEPRASVIWLHGLGASGNDFKPIVPHLNLPASLPVRFIFPNAPEIPVTINGGYIMPAWYDIFEMALERKIDQEQIEASSRAIASLIDLEIERGVPSEKIVLAGFSQGGAVAYQCALSYPKKLAGLLTMSTYFATADTLTIDECNGDINIQIQHGTLDEVVPIQLGESALQTLQEKNLKANFKRYVMAHEVCTEQIVDTGNLLTTWLS